MKIQVLISKYFFHSVSVRETERVSLAFSIFTAEHMLNLNLQ